MLGAVHDAFLTPLDAAVAQRTLEEGGAFNAEAGGAAPEAVGGREEGRAFRAAQDARPLSPNFR
eukprot:9048673-Pyramimonas_sp.AAC.1